MTCICFHDYLMSMVNSAKLCTAFRHIHHPIAYNNDHWTAQKKRFTKTTNKTTAISNHKIPLKTNYDIPSHDTSFIIRHNIINGFLYKSADSYNLLICWLTHSTGSHPQQYPQREYSPFLDHTSRHNYHSTRCPLSLPFHGSHRIYGPLLWFCYILFTKSASSSQWTTSWAAHGNLKVLKPLALRKPLN